MYLSDLRASLRRRWYLVLVGVGLTVGLAVAAAKAFPATYSSQAVVVLLPPSSADSANPYLALGGAEGVVPALSAAMTDSRTVLSLEASGVSPKFTVGPDLSAGGPLLLVTTEEAAATQSIRSLESVLGRISVVLDGLQAAAGAPPSSRVTADVIARDAKAQVVRKSQIRIIIVAAALGLAFTVLLTAGIDGLARRRLDFRSASSDSRRRRSGDIPNPASPSVAPMQQDPPQRTPPPAGLTSTSVSSNDSARI